jgi:hypothetical protein
MNVLTQIPLSIPDLIDPLWPQDHRLTVPPPLITGQEDPEAEAKREEWEAWRDGVMQYRTNRWWACGEQVDGATGEPFRVVNTDPEDVERNRMIEVERCRRDPAYFIAVWCAIKETRGAAEEDDDSVDKSINWDAVFSQMANSDAPEPPGWQPAVLYPFQVGMIRWIEWRVRAKKTGLVSKARDMGATWISTLWALHGWLFKKSFTAKFVSRNAAAVYSRSDDAMFSRVAAQFNHKPGSSAGNPLALPRWFWPQGFVPAEHCTEMLLTNPETGNEINGEATSKKTGRSGRGTVVIVDEMAFIDDPRHVFGTLRQTAGARIGLSSESDEVSDDFAQMCESRRARGDGSVLDLDYYLHPDHDKQWLDEMELEYREDGNLDGFLREVLRQAHAGMGELAYPYLKDNDVTCGDYPYVNGAPIWVTIDPGSDDECALHWLSRDPHAPTRVRLIRSYVNRGQPPEFYAHLIGGFSDIPGEDDDRGHPMWRWKPPEEDLLEWVQSLPVRPAFIYGDPAGGQNTAGKKSSWYDRMAVCWAQHGWVKGVSYKGAGLDTRPFQTRRTSLMRLLPRLDFHDGPGVKETLLAVANSKFDKTEDRATEQKTFKHDEKSHRRSALEFFAVWHLRVEVLTDKQNSWKPIVKKRRSLKRAA